MEKRTLRIIVLWALLGIAAFGGGAYAIEDWYLVEIADSKPPCQDVVGDESRCIGTNPVVARFEMKSGERLDLPRGPDIPPAWERLNEFWIYAPSVADSALRRSIALERTPMGARLIIVDQGRSYVSSLPLNEWVEMKSDLNPKLWVRVTESR